MKNQTLPHVVISFAKVIKNATMILLLLLLSFLMIKQMYYIGVCAINDSKNVHLILEQILNFFLYFAFFSMSVIYFKEGEHFPLRYLLYIGITATVRYIIVNRSDAFQNLLLTFEILLLIVGYLLLTPSINGFRNYLLEKRRQRLEQKGTSIQ